MLPSPLTKLSSSPAESRYLPLLQKRILHVDEAAGWDGLVGRLQSVLAAAEARWDHADRARFVEEAGDAVRSGLLLPNSPALVHCGTASHRFLACFALDARRPRDTFLALLRDIHDGMGGVGYTIADDLPPHRAKELIRLVDDDTAAHQNGRLRPASTAVTVPIDSPQLAQVLELSGTLRTTSLNVAISDAFFRRAAAGETLACAQLERLARAIHATGQPGVVFSDRIQRIARDASAAFATNVCGEAPLAADEAGVLGSINLVQCLRQSSDGGFTFDEAKFADAIRITVRLLDDLLELHSHAAIELTANTRATRKIGVGIMGFAHALALLEIPYGAPESIGTAERIGQLLMSAAESESEHLAHIRGGFPVWRQQLGIPFRRNATLVAIAATSTLALLAGTTGGIEPLFSHLALHRVMDETMMVLDPVTEFFGRRQGIEPGQLTRRLAAGEPLTAILGHDTARLLPRAHDVPAEQQIEIQASFQRHIDGGISKTVNCDAGTSVTDINRWLRFAHERGCLGLTIYRDGVFADQPIRDARGERTI